MLIGQRREFSFFVICFVKRAKLLAHDWSSGCLATAYSIEKLFSCNIGVSDREVDEEYIEELKDKSENENKKNSTEW